MSPFKKDIPEKTDIPKGKSKPRDSELWKFDKNNFKNLIERIENKKFVVALSAGRLKLGCHLPVLRLVEVLEHKVDELWGVSAGAIIGGLWSSGMTVRQIDKEVEALNLSLMFDLFNLQAIRSGIEALRQEKPIKTAGFFPGLKIENHIRELIENADGKNSLLDIHDFHAIAYNISRFHKTIFRIGEDNQVIHETPERDGKLEESLSNGDLADIIRASMSMSGIFWPKEIGGDFFLDGGVNEHLPIRSPFVRWINDVINGDEKRNLFILAIEASYWDPDSPPPPNPMSIISESFEILGVELSMDHEFYIRNFKPPKGFSVDLVIIRPELPYAPLTQIPDFNSQIRETRKEIIKSLSD